MGETQMAIQSEIDGSAFQHRANKQKVKPVRTPISIFMYNCADNGPSMKWDHLC